MFDAHEHVIFGYGSLLSHDSRFRHSSIDSQGIAVSVQGWQRSWVTRSTSERQTYVGAQPSKKGQINGLLLPLEEIDESLLKREQDYRFVQLDMSELRLHVESNRAQMASIQDKQIWMCETLSVDPADPLHPVYQSYVDTCLIGCLEAGGESFAEAFIESTHLWELHWVNDRAQPFYPRAAQKTDPHHSIIDSLLAKTGILSHRKETS